MSTPTIIDLKSAFLRTQILGLSRPLLPSPDWSYTPSAAEEAENALRQRNIDDALQRLNALLKQHHRAVYTPQGVRHVAEQIDALYWGAGESEREVGGDGVLGGDEDLRLEKNIENLPAADEVDGLGDEQVESYEVAKLQLEMLSARRREVREKVEWLRLLRERLSPFVEPKRDVQVNLCTRDGEVGKELERMKLLLARVGARVGALEGGVVNKEVENEKMNLGEVLRLMDVD